MTAALRTASPLRAASLRLLMGAVLAGATLASGAASAQDSGTGAFGNALRNLFNPSSPRLPDAGNAPAAEEDDFVCPRVEVLDGTAALRALSGAGGAGALRHQISIANLARECVVSGPNVILKIGVEGRVLLGPAGSPGTFTAPVRFVVKQGERVLFSRVQRVSVTVPAGEASASFVVIEPGLTVPKGDFDILVGLDGSAPRPEPRRRRSEG